MGYGPDALALKLGQEGKIMSKSLIVTVVKPSLEKSGPDRPKAAEARKV